MKVLGTAASGRYGLKKNLPGSCHFKDFEAYLLGRERFAKLQDAQALPVAIEINSDRYLQARLALLQEKLHQVDRLAGQGELPDAEITGELLKSNSPEESGSRGGGATRRGSLRPHAPSENHRASA